MKTSLATMLSITGVLAAGALAFTVNTSVLDHAVTTSEAAPALQADVIALSNFTPSVATTPAAAVEPTVAAQSTYNIDGVAAITLSLNNNLLSVVSVSPVSGCTFITAAESNSRIAVALTLGNSVMTFHAEVLDGRIVTSIIAEQSQISSAAPKKRSNDDDNDKGNEKNEHEDDRDGDDD